MEIERLKPSELRRTLRLRRKQLRRDLALMRQSARARWKSLRPRSEVSRRRRRGAVAAALLLMAALLRCECEKTPLPAKLEAKVEAEEKAENAPKPPVRRRTTRAPLTGEIDRQARGAYSTGAPPPPTWIDEFRLQAAARSPRLAQCFDGSERPGALRWMAALNPETGTVSDHDLEPVGLQAQLTGEQRICVVSALSHPRYRISTLPAQPFPERVSLVIEF